MLAPDSVLYIPEPHETPLDRGAVRRIDHMGKSNGVAAVDWRMKPDSAAFPRSSEARDARQPWKWWRMIG